MGISSKPACPSPQPAYRTQESPPPSTGVHSPPAQGFPPTPAQARRVPPVKGQPSLPAQGPDSGVRGQWDYSFHTLNINAWSSFKIKLDDQHFRELFGQSTVLLVQEHKMLTHDEIEAAVTYCARRGYNATFGLAKKLDSGKASGGVGVLIQDGLNIGITRIDHDYDGLEHRLLAVRVKAPGSPPHAVISLYCEAVSGLSATNRALLAQLATIQHEAKLPIIAGGDFNMLPRVLLSSDFLSRANLRVAAPQRATCVTKQASRIIDYYLVSEALAHSFVQCDTVQYFLRPHRPVHLTLRLDQELIPILCKAPKLPTTRPYGPQQQEDDWDDLAHSVADLIRDLPSDPEARLPFLDKAYRQFTRAMVVQVSRATDTPVRQHQCRLQPPTIKWVTQEQRQERQIKAWRCLEQPLSWLQGVSYHAHQAASRADPSTIDLLQHELEDPPCEYHSHPGLMGLLAQARTALAAIAATTSPLTKEEQLTILDRLIESIASAMEEEHRLQSASAQEQWRHWVQNSMGVNPGWAHRWSKVSATWRPPRGDLQTLGRPTDKLDVEAERLSSIWGCSRSRTQRFRASQSDIDTLPPVTVEELRKAISTFPRNTAHTWDGLHPRHFLLLSDLQLEVVIALMHLIEQVGEMPSCLQGVVATLIPKLKGDSEAYRSIGMMPGLYRVWARVRAPMAKQWERSHKNAALGHQSGRSLLELVFLQAMLAEAGAHGEEPEASASFLWDLSNFYEHVPRDVLWAHGQEQGFNEAILAVALNQYGSQRVVTLHGVARNVLYPARGIAAGCGFATFLVQILALPALIRFQHLYPFVWLTMFIDDLLVHSRHRQPAQVISRLAEAGAALHDIITHDWGCCVATQKSVIVGSSVALCKSLEEAFGQHTGQIQPAAANLGVDTWMGKRRSRRTTGTLRGRLLKLRRRGRKLSALKAAAPEPSNMVHLYKTGLQSFGYFGAEVVGITDNELHQAQHHYLAVCGGASQARHKHLSMCLLTDPLWRQAFGPALLWASIVWKAATARELFSIWPLPWLGQEAGKIIRSLPSTWATVRGPIGAAYLSLRRAGWTFATPFQLLDPAGDILNLTDTSPALLAHRLRLDWNRLHLEGARRSLQLPRDDTTDVDFAAARSLLLDRNLPAHARGILHRYLTQTLWSCERLHHVGYAVVQGCPHCGHHRDDLHHRLFACPHSEALRHQLLQSQDVDHLQRHPHLLFGCQLLPVVPQNRPPGYGYEQYHSYTVDDRPPKDHFQNNTVYSDGSCSKTVHANLNSAGWALVALDSDGNLTAAIWGQVGRSLPQTSPASEYVAGMAAANMQASEVRADFKGLAALSTSSMETASHRKNVYSGLRVQIKGKAPQMSSIKVNAHVDPSSCTVGSPAWRDAVGNQLADQYAKKGANLHFQPSSEELATISKDRDVLVRFLRYVSHALALWEPVGPTSGTRKHTIPKLPSIPDLVPGAVGRSFRSDVLGPWAHTEGTASSSVISPFGAPSSDAPPPPQPHGESLRRRLRGKQAERLASGVSGGGLPPKHGHHEWRFRRNHWVCAACLKVSRASAPSRCEKCPGFNKVMADLLVSPREHALSYSSFLDSTGIIILCTRCGGHCASNRRSRKLSETCRGRPASACAGAALTRMCKLWHPVHAKGDGVVFDAWRPLSDLGPWPRGGPRADAPP